MRFRIEDDITKIVSSPTTKERGILLLLDEAFIQRLDYETAIVRRDRRANVPRTEVMRELLRERLDERAQARGDLVAILEPISAGDREGRKGTGEDQPRDVGDVCATAGEVVDRGEGTGEVGAQALAAETGPSLERVTPGRLGGNVRMVGVRGNKA